MSWVWSMAALSDWVIVNPWLSHWGMILFKSLRAMQYKINHLIFDVSFHWFSFYLLSMLVPLNVIFSFGSNCHRQWPLEALQWWLWASSSVVLLERSTKRSSQPLNIYDEHTSPGWFLEKEEKENWPLVGDYFRGNHTEYSMLRIT